MEIRVPRPIQIYQGANEVSKIKKMLLAIEKLPPIEWRDEDDKECMACGAKMEPNHTNHEFLMLKHVNKPWEDIQLQRELAMNTVCGWCAKKIIKCITKLQAARESRGRISEQMKLDEAKANELTLKEEYLLIREEQRDAAVRAKEARRLRRGKDADGDWSLPSNLK